MASAPWFSPARASSRLAVACLLAAGCGSGRTVTLGDGLPRPYQFGAPTILPELTSTTRSDNPTLTSDLLEIYFTSVRGGDSDVWFAKRARAGLPFGAPMPVVEVNTPMFETSSAISADGLTLWFGSDRAGGAGLLDIWESTRPTQDAAWSTPVNVVALNSAEDDIPRSPGDHGRVMPMASAREVAGRYWTYLATQPTAGAPSGAPALVSELAYPDRSTVDAFLTDDGLTMFFSSARFAPPPTDGGESDAAAPDASDASVSVPAVTSDLYVAWRRSAGEGFLFRQPLSDLNTSADERDPWLSPDGKILYFTSDRDGVLSIYAAPVLPR